MGVSPSKWQTFQRASWKNFNCYKVRTAKFKIIAHIFTVFKRCSSVSNKSKNNNNNHIDTICGWINAVCGVATISTASCSANDLPRCCETSWMMMTFFIAFLFSPSCFVSLQSKCIPELTRKHTHTSTHMPLTHTYASLWKLDAERSRCCGNSQRFATTLLH